jgi:hypothetical protein
MKSGIKLDTIVKDWFLVDSTHLGEPMDKRILWSIVVQYRKRRWVNGDFCCTSLVLRELKTQLCQTKNNVYRAEGNWQRV